MKNNQSGYQPLSFEKDRLQTAAIFMSQRWGLIIWVLCHCYIEAVKIKPAGIVRKKRKTQLSENT